MGDYGADKFPAVNKIRTVAFDFGFAPQVNLKVDQFSTTTSIKVYTLVVKIGSTNLKVKVSPVDIPG